MPSPYSSAQGTYVEAVFEKILTDNGTNQQYVQQS